jgi:hypothetical protein
VASFQLPTNNPQEFWLISRKFGTFDGEEHCGENSGEMCYISQNLPFPFTFLILLKLTVNWTLKNIF